MTKVAQNIHTPQFSSRSILLSTSSCCIHWPCFAWETTFVYLIACSCHCISSTINLLCCNGAAMVCSFQSLQASSPLMYMTDNVMVSDMPSSNSRGQFSLHCQSRSSLGNMLVMGFRQYQLEPNFGAYSSVRLGTSSFRTTIRHYTGNAPGEAEPLSGK